jgi:hypothetical protein
MMYAKCQDKQLEEEGYRKALIKNYVLVHKINETSKTVSILRFFYSAQDYVKENSHFFLRSLSRQIAGREFLFFWI